MNIEWTRCSDLMPSHEEIIVRYQFNKPQLFDGQRFTESFARIFPNLINQTAWTKFTTEKWEYLNK